jgi:hypothetical protein
MTLMRVLIIAAAFAAGFSLPTQAQDAAKRSDIVHLMQVTGALKLGDQMAISVYQQMAQAMKESNPNIPQGALDIVERETIVFIRDAMEAAVPELVAMYEQTFSHQEVKDMLAFYSTDTGKKTIAVLPAMMQQAMTMGQKSIEKLAPQFQQRLVAKLNAAGYN